MVLRITVKTVLKNATSALSLSKSYLLPYCLPASLLSGETAHDDSPVPFVSYLAMIYGNDLSAS